MTKAHGFMTAIAQEYAAGELEDQDLYPTRDERILANGDKVRGSRTVVRSTMFRNTKFEIDHPLCTESADAADDSFGEEMPGMLMDDGV